MRRAPLSRVLTRPKATRTQRGKGGMKGENVARPGAQHLAAICIARVINTQRETRAFPVCVVRGV